MWRIYSKEANGVRLRSRIGSLLNSLYHSGVNRPDRSCVIGKVRYLPEKKLLTFANSLYQGGGLTKKHLFQSLLVKRRAFEHEKEIRLLYYDVMEQGNADVVPYRITPHELIDQIMLDPRFSYAEFKKIKSKIRAETNFEGEILRSLLYRAPEERVLEERGSSGT